MRPVAVFVTHPLPKTRTQTRTRTRTPLSLLKYSWEQKLLNRFVLQLQVVSPHNRGFR